MNAAAVLEMQKNWADAIITISNEHKDGVEFMQAAADATSRAQLLGPGPTPPPMKAPPGGIKGAPSAMLGATSGETSAKARMGNVLKTDGNGGKTNEWALLFEPRGIL